MASKLSIKNMALTSLGEEALSVSDEGTKASNDAETFFTQALDELLARHDWKFAHKRVAISSEVDTPAFGYDYQYLLPSDCIRVSEVNGDSDSVFETELGKILTDSDYCQLKYVSRITNYILLPPLFVAALADLLASKMAYGLAGGKDKATERLQFYEVNFAKALVADSEAGLGVVEADEAGEDSGEWRNRVG